MIGRGLEGWNERERRGEGIGGTRRYHPLRSSTKKAIDEKENKLNILNRF